MSSRQNLEFTEQFQSNDSTNQKGNDNVERPYSKESFEKGEGHDLYVPSSSEWGGHGDEAVNSIHSMFANVEDSKTAMAMPNAWEGDAWNGESSPLSAQKVIEGKSSPQSGKVEQQCDNEYGGGGGGGTGGGGGDAGNGAGDGAGAAAGGAGASNGTISSAEAATVQITAQDGGGEESLGSGFFVSSNGLISTDYHVVQGAQGPIQITTADGQTLEAEPVVTDQANDIAILQIVGQGANQNFSSLQLGQDGDVTGTDTAIGHPEGDPNIVVDSGNFVGEAPFGSFDVTDNTVNDNPNRNLLEFANMDTQPGSSGSPIINSNGVVIGMDDLGDGQGDADATLVSAISADVALAEGQAA